MNVDMTVLLIIIGCAVVTFIPRIAPFAVIRSLHIPPAILKWLSYIPICLLTALIVQGLLEESDPGLPTVNWLNLAILAPTLLTAIKSKSLLATVVVGIGSAALLRWIF
ncbi:MAG: branched-chain amino acid transporter AzlD [Paenibacillus sp.]|nr:branched-chain amino acid transporter AzlD [Paenibacillus sp.]